MYKQVSTLVSYKKTIALTRIKPFDGSGFTSEISLNFSKQKGFKKKIIESTVLLGTKILNKEQLNFKEKIINFFCEKLVRKKIKKQ